MKNQKKHRSSSGDGHRRWCECGVSEVIGVVLLLALVVVGGTIVGTQLLSQPAPKNIPSVSFLANYDPGTLSLYHTGGDTLPKGEYKFLVQYANGTSATYSPTTDWISGHPLTYPAITQPARVTLVYTGNGAGETALKSVVIGDVGSDAAGQSANGGTGVNPGVNTGITFTITALFNPSEGSILCNTSSLTNSVAFTVNAGDTPTLTFPSSTGFKFDDAIITGDKGASITVTTSPYIFTTGIDQNYTVTATFSEIATSTPAHYRITPIFDSLRGNITCNGTQLVNNNPFDVNAGDTPTLTFPTSTGFKFDRAIISGDKDKSATVTSDPYSFTSFTTGIDQNYTVTVTFSEIVLPVPAHYTITPIFDNLKGNITCNGTQLVNNIPFEVNAGDIPTLTFPTSTGFMFDKALISGDKGASATVTGSPYTFTTGVNQNYTVTATFSEIVPARYTITPIFDSLKGKVTCNGTQLVNNSPFEVNAGDMPAFTFLPSTGFMFDTALISGDKGVSATATGSPYTFDRGVDQNYTVDVNFTVAMFTITANTGPLGTINQSGSRSFPYHSIPSFGVEAISGYHIVNIIVDGKEQGPASNYTFSPLEADHTITADFAKNVYTITATAGDGGSITPAGSVSAEFGDNKTFAIAAGSGNTIDDVVVDGISVGQVTSVTFNQVSANHTIQASFDIDGVGSYIIEGYVSNGIPNSKKSEWDPDAPRLGGWTVEALVKGQAQGWYVIRTAITDENGYYIMDHMPKDHYHVQLVPQSGWEQTYPTKHNGYDVTELNNGHPDEIDNFMVHPTGEAGEGQILLNNPSNIGVMKDGTFIQFTGNHWVEWPQPTHTDDWIQMDSSATLASGLDMDPNQAYRIRIPWQTKVKIVMNGDQAKGQIYIINNNQISTFDFNNVKVYFDGNLVATGKITGIWVNTPTNLLSTLTYVMGTENSGAQFAVDGTDVIKPAWWPLQKWGVTVYGISPRSAQAQDNQNILNFNYDNQKTYLICSGGYALFRS